MGEIRIVGPGKTCGYPYSVCKKRFVGTGETRDILFLRIRQSFSFFIGAGKFGLAQGLRQLTRDKVTSIVYNDTYAS